MHPLTAIAKVLKEMGFAVWSAVKVLAILAYILVQGPLVIIYATVLFIIASFIMAWEHFRKS